MKRILVALSVLTTLAACNNTPSADKATTGTAQEASKAEGDAYVVDTASSLINWRATHKGGLNPRFGTLNISDGSFSVENDQITAGSFTVNLNSLTVDPKSVTEPGKKPEELVGHLKSADFFDVAKYPTVKFDITKVEPYDSTKAKSLLPGATNLVSGNLTIKDSSVNVTFPAIIKITEGKSDFQAAFTVDRTTWGLKYGAQGNNPADWLISKDIELKLNVKGAKK